MGTRSDGGGFWWDQSAIKFMFPQVMKQVTYNLLHTVRTCTIFVNEFLTTTLCSSKNNVEKVEKVHMYSVLHTMVHVYVQSKGIK